MQVQEMEKVHGEARTAELLRELIDMPNRAWSVTQDLQLLINHWASRAKPGASVRTPARPVHKKSKAETNELRLAVLRKKLSADVARRFVALSPGPKNFSADRPVRIDR